MIEVVDRHGRKLREHKQGETLADGEFVRVPMTRMLFDSRGEPARIADALAGHRPGYHVADAATRERAAGGRAVYVHALQNAYRTADAAPTAPKSAEQEHKDYKTRLGDAWRSGKAA